jgi:hypothetical protein
MVRLTKEAIAKYKLRAVLGHRDLSPDKDKDGQVEPHEWVKMCPCFNAAPEYAELLKPPPVVVSIVDTGPRPIDMTDLPFLPPPDTEPKETPVNPLILGTLCKVVERVLERPNVPVENSKSGVVANAVVDAIRDSPNVAVVPVEAASKSKTIWLQAAGVVASLAAFFGLDIPADDLAAVIGGIQAAVAVGTVVLRKWFTRSVTPAAAARP